MATRLRNTFALLTQIVAGLKVLAERIGAGASFHLDASDKTVTAADASSLATSITLANQVKAVYEDHLASTAGHKLADPAPALVVASTLATGITLANAIKADYNTHRASTTYHYNADATNVVTSADATDQTSLNTLLNEIKVDLNAHMASAPAGALLRLDPA